MSSSRAGQRSAKQSAGRVPAARWWRCAGALAAVEVSCARGDVSGATSELRQAHGNNVHASHVLLDTLGPAARDASWVAEASLPQLHAMGIQGSGQIIGLGDTGVNVQSCGFADRSEQAPVNDFSATHRKVAAYFSVNGDTQDGPSGHGTHVAGSMLMEASQSGLRGSGVAPAARLVVVDVELTSDPGRYRIPDSSIDTLYFDLFRNAGASTVCSPWSFPDFPDLEMNIDAYVWKYPEFLPVFPVGNTVNAASTLPQSPCKAKNVLCVGASFNSRNAYMDMPDFSHVAMLVGDKEINVLPANFGTTAPQNTEECMTVADSCLSTKAACPECAFNKAALGGVSQARATAARPIDGCSALVGFAAGTVCVVQRGTCNFETKALNCQDAGAIGVIVVNYVGGKETIMDSSTARANTLAIPVILVPQDVAGQVGGRLVTFPVLQQGISPLNVAPYSAFGSTTGGRVRPELVFPGDNIHSADASLACGLRVMSGTSQSCGFAAGSVALTRGYLQTDARQTTARLSSPWASTLRATLALAAQTAGTTVRREDVGFGLPVLARLFTATSNFYTLQSRVTGGQTQRYSFTVGSWPHPDLPPSVVLAWTDPPASDNALVNDLDLVVACGIDWRSRLGNGKVVTPDRIETVEKVALRDVAEGTVCIISVDFPRGSAPTSQPFSLVAAGFEKLRPGFEAAAVHPTCSEHGRAVLAEQGAGWVTWACSCADGWFGPLCQQQAAELQFQSGVSAASVAPWQWDFSAVKLCGDGEYEFEVTSSALGSLGLAASTVPGPPLWSSAAGLGASTARSEVRADVSVRLRSSEGLVSLRLAAASGAAAAVAAPAFLYLSAFNSGRDGATQYNVRWLKGPSACGLVASLRGSQAGGQESGPTVGKMLLYCFIAVLVVGVLLTVQLLWCHFRRRAKVAPEPSMTLEPSSTTCAESSMATSSTKRASAKISAASTASGATLPADLRTVDPLARTTTSCGQMSSAASMVKHGPSTMTSAASMDRAASMRSGPSPMSSAQTMPIANSAQPGASSMAAARSMADPRLANGWPPRPARPPPRVVANGA